MLDDPDGLLGGVSVFDLGSGDWYWRRVWATNAGSGGRGHDIRVVARLVVVRLLGCLCILHVVLVDEWP